MEQGDRQRERLSREIENRDLIGQAKGILMSRRQISADEAFTLLRRTSQNFDVKLVELALALTEEYTDLATT